VNATFINPGLQKNVLPLRLENRVAVVTGAAQGIGKEISSTFAQEGADLVLLDLSDKVFDIEEEFRKKGCRALSVKADVSDFEKIKQAAELAIRKFGRVDVLVNNAGISLPFSLEKFSGKDLDKVMAVNLKGVFNCCMAFLPYMIDRKYGRIINISSIAGISIGTKSAYYSASKAAVIGFTRSLALWLAEYGITVNAICPGVVRTELTESSLGRNLLDKLAERIPMKRLALPRDVANLALFLASDESSYITGQYIIIDGGLTIKSDVW